MSPNIFLATKMLVSPHKWFVRRPSQKSPKTSRRCEHWDAPIPGIYEYRPGSGWYLITLDEEVQSSDDKPAMKLPQPIIYSSILHRHMLYSEYKCRRQHSSFKDSEEKLTTATFFQLDDDVTWVMAWDGLGRAIYGGLERWIVDKQTGQLRPMLNADDTELKSRMASKNSSVTALSPEVPSSRTVSIDASSSKTPTVEHTCITCGSSTASSLYNLDLRKTFSSTRPPSVMEPSTALTTPLSAVESKEDEQLSAIALRMRLMELGNA
jgi:hypothetical protein